MSLNHCCVCGDELQSRKRWLFECRSCGYLASNLEPDAGTGIDGLAELRRLNFEAILNRLSQLRTLAGLRLLEVGCAAGQFLEAAAARGVRVMGIEPEQGNAAMARANGLRILDGYFPADGPYRGPFDIIVFNDVFEHLPDPDQCLRHIEQLLAPGGIAVLNLPSSTGMLYRVADGLDRLGYSDPLERLWQKDLPSPHVSYFNAGNLAALVTRSTNLKVIARMSLPSMTRSGLRSRVKSVNKGISGDALFTGAWMLSFVAPILPSDIMVLLLERGVTPSEPLSESTAIVPSKGDG